MNITIPYSPRAYFLPLHNSGKRFNIIVAHRRAGKTLAAINQLIRDVLTCDKPNPRGAYIAPTFSHAKDVSWTYLKEYTRNIPGMQYFESELRADFPTGARIRLYGAENPDRLRGLYFDSVVVDEYASMASSIWTEAIRPALSDRQGRITFLGTPKGQDAFFDLYTYAVEHPNEWYSLSLPASETGILPPDELLANSELMDESTYLREFECSFDAAFEGAYYLKDITRALMEKRIRPLLHDPATDVYSGWDLGIADSMAYWTFQVYNNEWRWLSYYENTGMGLHHYIDHIQKLPYEVYEHFLPHDADVRELQTGKSRKLFMEERGMRVTVVPRSKIEDGIQAVRAILSRSYFDTEGTKQGVHKLKNYRTEYNEKSKSLSLKPLHDWASHGADAIRTAVLGLDEHGLKVNKSDWSKPINRQSEGTYV